jgi:hypothetical protein
MSDPITPITPAGLRQYDHLPPLEAVLAAWTRPGPRPDWHEKMRERVRLEMPLLARALDRATTGGRPLDADSTVATLACHLPAGVTMPDTPGVVAVEPWTARDVAQFLADHLATAGYGLVELPRPDGWGRQREQPVPWRDEGERSGR